MGQIGRFMFAIKVTIGSILMAILYFRVGIDYLQPMVLGETEAFVEGPLTSVASLAFWAVPVAMGIILITTWGWVIISPQQEEKARARTRP